MVGGRSQRQEVSVSVWTLTFQHCESPAAQLTTEKEEKSNLLFLFPPHWGVQCVPNTQFSRLALCDIIEGTDTPPPGPAKTPQISVWKPDIVTVPATDDDSKGSRASMALANVSIYSCIPLHGL